MRQIIAGISRISLIKCKFNNLHIRVSAFLYQPSHRIRHKTKILCNDILMAKTMGNRTEQIHSRSFFPPPVSCGSISVGNGIVFIKSPEMINTHHIIHFKTVSKAFDPPFKAGLTMNIPVIKGIAPQLACGRKTIRRTSCHLCRPVFSIQLKQPGACPRIRAVHGNINRNISDNADILFICICFQLIPLLIELKLHVFLEFNVII